MRKIVIEEMDETIRLTYSDGIHSDLIITDTVNYGITDIFLEAEMMIKSLPEWASAKWRE